MRTEECLSSLGGAGGERKVYYKLINGKLYPFYYHDYKKFDHRKMYTINVIIKLKT